MQTQPTSPLPSPTFLGRSASTPSALALPTLGFRACCGFPSPAEDFLGEDLDLSDLCIRNPVATFFAQAEGDSMKAFGIEAGDMLIIDKSVEAKHGDIVLVLWEGGLTVKQLRFRRHGLQLVSGDDEVAPIVVDEDCDLQVWGVITWSFKKQLCR